ncbi:MAG TPA: TlpA disulfide reductase family protein [Acidimicrobiales bacterium]|nr:TlpA disulfide reductase family protein [Acidimicrobiales bacterium]
MSEVLDPPPPAAAEAPRRPARPARAIAIGVAVLVALFIVIAAAVKGGVKETAETPLLGLPAPVVQTTTIDGSPFDLASRRGSWVVLNFFSTWCRPCVEEHPELVRFAAAEAARPEGAELYSVIFNDDTDKVESFFADRGGAWPKLTDPDGQVQVAFGVAKSPETWIIDPAGVVRARMISTVTDESLTELLDGLRSGLVPGS